MIDKFERLRRESMLFSDRDIVNLRSLQAAIRTWTEKHDYECPDYMNGQYLLFNALADTDEQITRAIEKHTVAEYELTKDASYLRPCEIIDAECREAGLRVAAALRQGDEYAYTAAEDDLKRAKRTRLQRRREEEEANDAATARISDDV